MTGTSPAGQDTAPVDPGKTVKAELAGNDFRIALIKAVGAGLVALISLSQLASGARLGKGGQTWLMPGSVTALVFSAVFFGLAFANFSFESAALRMRLAATGEQFLNDPVPNESIGKQKSPRERGESGRKQWTLGLGFGAVALAFYLISVWWPSFGSGAHGKTPENSSVTSSTVRHPTTSSASVPTTIVPTVTITTRSPRSMGLPSTSTTRGTLSTTASTVPIPTTVVTQKNPLHHAPDPVTT